MFVRRASVRAFAAYAALALLACGGDLPDRVDVALTVDTIDRIGPDELVEIAYEWIPGESYLATDEPLRVFVHVVDSEGAIVAQDDHTAPRPSNEWHADEPVSYRRWVWLPSALSGDHVDFVIGLYSPTGRLQLQRADTGTWTTEHRTRVTLDANAPSALPRPRGGWHRLEMLPDGGRFHWTEGVAHAVFDNPGHDAVLIFDADIPAPLMSRSPYVTLTLNNQWLGRLEPDEAGHYAERIPLSAEDLGEEPVVELTIRALPVFVPSEIDPTSGDTRSLGVKVNLLYLSSLAR